MYDLARGNYDSIHSLKRFIKFVSECGLNIVTFYMEDLWQYKTHPRISNPHAYKLEDMKFLAEYAEDYNITLIPSLTTLGHSHHILDKPGYRHLAFPGEHADFDVLNPSVYEFFDELFHEVLPYFKSPYVFINGDEVNLSHLSEEAKMKAKQQGLGYLYGIGMKKIGEMVISYGKRPVMWHDMLLHHPESIEIIPKETIIAYWYYDYQSAFPAIPFFCSKGFDVIACPGLLRHGDKPDYARALPNIEGQILECINHIEIKSTNMKNKNTPGRCLGVLLTIWEKLKWENSILAIYALGEKIRNPGYSHDRILNNFAQNVFGIKKPKSGQLWEKISMQYGKVSLLSNSLNKGQSSREKYFIRNSLNTSMQKFYSLADKLSDGKPVNNVMLYAQSKSLIQKMLKFKPDIQSKKSNLKNILKNNLFTSSLVDVTDKKCRIIETKTPYGHKLLILTNGFIAIAILPEFAATMIEWVLIKGTNFFSFLTNEYREWADKEKRIPGDITLGSPWGAVNIGGWRETIFYNTRLNPSSLWGRTFDISSVRLDEQEITIVCRGKNEVAEINRMVSIKKGETMINIDITARNLLSEDTLAIQPNQTHVFPGTCPAILQLIEKKGEINKKRSILDYNGTKLFSPWENAIRVVSPLNKHFLNFEFQKKEIEFIFTEVAPKFFTLEPFGKMVKCKKHETVHMELQYKLG
jgi:hypothetical protein